MVVVHHALNPMDWLFNPIKGYEAFAWGVDIFFVISGFIMYVAARSESPAAFIWLRIVRVVPLYWLVTVGFIFLFYKERLFHISMAEAKHLVLSLLFVPHYSFSKPDQIWPFLIPGWTLNYEMFFYCLFCAALFLGRPLLMTTVFIASLVCVGLVFDFSGNAILLTYTNPILVEFIAGVWVGRLYVLGRLNERMAVLFPLGFVGLMSLPLILPGGQEIWFRVACGVSIVIGAVSISHAMPRLDVLTKIGDASYSIYLTHTIVGLVLSRKLFISIPIHGWAQFVGYVISSLFLSVFTGYLIYRYVEKPLLRRLRPARE